ncbi:hypothetical protein IGI04_008507 [Brassica rapa subsp. trilocularis]|uniref:Uncharacterized protein n=1 Tax=Brassica rapa subsp. trilocularis TaxID=1813537 RepID=A0ABQ7NMU9_BRACM|nr:hypothetical protein IGI04_008507 [Brassica rapa subsp. trilocularis]
MADLSLAQGRGRGEVGVVRFSRSVLSPGGGGSFSSAVAGSSPRVVEATLALTASVLVCLGGGRSRRRLIEARSWLIVLGRAKLLSRFHRKWKAFAVAMCGLCDFRDSLVNRRWVFLVVCRRGASSEP